MATPRVSVLIPVFNTAEFVLEALQSIAFQTFTDLELIVIDDGSHDNSNALLVEFAAREPRMTLIARENRGLIATRNELLSMARGEFVAWMDSDDVSTPERLALQLAAFATSPNLVCVGGFAQCMDPQGEYLNIERYPLSHEEIVAEQRGGGGFRFATALMKRSAAIRVGSFREPFRIGEDFDFLLRLGELGELGNVPDVIYLYRQHISSVCAQMRPQWYAYRDTIIALAQERRDHGQDRLQRGAQLNIVVPEGVDDRNSVPTTYAIWSRCALDNGNRRLAIRYAVSAIRAEPTVMTGWASLARVALHRLRDESALA